VTGLLTMQGSRGSMQGPSNPFGGGFRRF
jgi:hypothetical protein